MNKGRRLLSVLIFISLVLRRSQRRLHGDKYFGAEGQGKISWICTQEPPGKVFSFAQESFSYRARKFFFSGSIPFGSLGVFLAEKEGCLRVYSGHPHQIFRSILRYSIFNAALNNLFRKESLSLYCETMAKANFLNVFRMVAE